MKMLRICQRLNAWRTVHRRPIPVTASYSPVLSSCPNAYTTSKQPESVLPNQWCSRSYSKNVQEQPNRESFDFMKAYQKPINDYYAENIYKGHLSIILGVIKIAAVYQSIWCTISYNQIIDYISKFDDPLTTVAMYSAAGTVVFVIPALLHAVNKNIAFDITHNPDTDEYTASTISWLVLKKFVKFKINDVEVVQRENKIFTKILIGEKKTPLIITRKEFVDLVHFRRFMNVHMEPKEESELKLRKR